ncbi:MAG: beta-N-acetylhexosaminidase [Myxococcales bacterium]|nr:beta-N-acetylhexosaminidase [Myxococcales bacterium]
MPSTLSTLELTGQLIVGGFSGTSLPGEMRDVLSAGRRGGVIVFKRNLPSLEAAHALNLEVIQATPAALPPFISVDQEGGRVGRLPAPFLKLPPMRALGTLADAELVRRIGVMLGQELSALGYNLDFAPVLDVDSNPANPIIGDRAFSSDPTQVSRLAGALAAGLESAGVMACGKHFPGHGDTLLDSHLALPFVDHSEARLRELELPPFGALARLGIASFMSAHVVYPALDPAQPATLSERIATRMLRSELGFAGVLFSDDLEMKALADRMPVEESAVRAIRAGCDALLICSDFALQERAHAALTAEAERSPEFRERCEQAVGRCLSARRRFPPRPAADASKIGGPSVKALEAELAERLS